MLLGIPELDADSKVLGLVIAKKKKKKNVHRGLGHLSTVTEHHTPTAPPPTHGNTHVNTPRNVIVI